MKTIGIIGGIGVPSTVKYYEWLNDGVKAALGAEHSVKLVITSVNGEEIKNFRIAGDVAGEGAFFANEAKRLEAAGADFILIGSNTSHRNAHFVEEATNIPLLHLAGATAEAVLAKGIKKIAFIGTSTAMEEDFYKDRLIKAGLDVMIPEKDDRDYISHEIYNYLIQNTVRPEAVERFTRILSDLRDNGAEGAILGCTELTLLNLQSTDDFPLFDTVQIHVAAALKQALAA